MPAHLPQSFTRVLYYFSFRIRNRYLCQKPVFKMQNVFRHFSVLQFGINTRCLSSAATSQTETQHKTDETTNSQPEIPEKDKVKFKFKLPITGEIVEAEGKVGESVMAVGIKYPIDMEGACEGTFVCGTCHVYVDERFQNLFPEPTEQEADVLAKVPDLKENSRLGCQCFITKDLEGSVFSLPEEVMGSELMFDETEK